MSLTRTAGPWIGALAVIAAAFVLGLATRPPVEPPAESPPHGPAAPPPARRLRSPPPAASELSPSEDPRWAELEGELERTRELERELYGKPAPWPDPAHKAEAEQQMRGLLDEVVACLGPGWEVAEADCAEQPCIAALWGPNRTGDELRACSPTEVWSRITAWNTECADGARMLWLSDAAGSGGSDRRRSTVRREELRGRLVEGCGGPTRR